MTSILTRNPLDPGCVVCGEGAGHDYHAFRRAQYLGNPPAEDGNLQALASEHWHQTARKLKTHQGLCVRCQNHLRGICELYDEAQRYAAAALAFKPDDPSVQSLQAHFTQAASGGGKAWLKQWRDNLLSKPNQLEGRTAAHHG